MIASTLLRAISVDIAKILVKILGDWRNPVHRHCPLVSGQVGEKTFRLLATANFFGLASGIKTAI